MTQGAIMLNAERVVMGASTATTDPRMDDGTHAAGGHGARICILPHINAALLFRGEIAHGASMYSRLLMAARADLDDTVREVWPRLDKELWRTRGGEGPARDRRGFEAVLAGWSPERKAMVGFAWTPDEGDDPGTLPLLEFVAALPGTVPGLQDQLAGFEGVEPSPERVVEIMRLQARAMEQDGRAESRVGGDVCVVEIGWEGVCSSVWRGG